MERFEVKSLVVALAGAFSGMMAVNAVAQNQLPFTAATLNGATVVYISGATAQDTGLRNVLRRLCLPGTLDQFSASNQNAYLCAPNTAQANIAGNLVVYKSGVGGSGNGVQPVANATPLTFFNLGLIFANEPSFCNTIVNENAVAAITPDTIGLPAFRRRTCVLTGTTSTNAPDAGLSDVEPALLGATPTQIAALNTKGANQLVFGVPVTLAMYRGLQAAQGLGADDGLANQPSLSRMQIANIFLGSITSTAQLATSTGGNLPAQELVVAQRVATSGSQAITEVFFLNGRCATGAPVFGGPDADNVADNQVAYDACRNAPTDSAFRLAGSGSGQVLQCLRGADFSGRWGVGLLSTETVPAISDANGTIRYIRIDGASPNLLDVAQGKYQFVAEQAMQWRNTLTVGSAPNIFRTVDYIRTQLGNPNVIRALNASFVQAFGQSGLIGVPDGSTITPNGVPLSLATVANTPVNTWSKSALGSLNNCVVPTIVNRQPVLPQ